MTTFYFTSTGNSLFVAGRIGGKLISIPKAIKNNEYKFEDDKIGFVFPVYGMMPTPIVVDFIKKATFKANYFFTVLTYGTFCGGALTKFSEILKEKDIPLSYGNTYHMAENFLPAFNMKKSNKSNPNGPLLNSICHDIDIKRYYIKKSSFIADKITSKHEKNYKYSRGIGVSKELSVSENCNGCAVCTKVCPTDNIRLIDGKPSFGSDCLGCFACAQNCPNKAIKLNNEKGSERYRNPNISLNDIIEANN